MCRVSVCAIVAMAMVAMVGCGSRKTVSHLPILPRPRTARQYFERGRTLVIVGDIREAARDFERASRLQPDKLVIYYSLANCYEALNEPDNAIRTWRRLARRRLPRQEASRAYGFLGDAQMDHNRTRAAAESYRRSIELDPRNAASNCTLGYMALYAHHVASAHALFIAGASNAHRAVNLAGAHAGLGAVAAERGDYRTARAEYRLALKIDPGNEFARSGLSRLSPSGSVGTGAVRRKDGR